MESVFVLTLIEYSVKELKGERDRRVVSGNDNPIENNNSDKGASGGEDYDYGNDDSYQDDYADGDYGTESDDPELYHDDDDDFFLDEEYFPSDGDVHILDEDFPHENTHRYFHDSPSGGHHHHHGHSPSSRRHHHHFGASGGGFGQTRINKPLSSADQRRGGDSEQQQQQQNLLSASDNLYDTGDIGTPVRRPSATSMHRSHSTASGSDFATATTAKVSMAQQPAATADTTDDEDFMFNQQTIEDFIKFHRAEIREVAESAKKETKLLANFSLSITSLKESQEAGGQRRAEDNLKMSSEFIDYLDRLDEVLEMKMGAIEALRDRIRRVLGEDDI